MLLYQDLLTNLQSSNKEYAEHLEEEINILVHKLKFLPQESFPSVAILDQEHSFDPLYDAVLEEKVKIAGGVLINDLALNPHIILIKQTDATLYSTLPLLLHQRSVQDSNAHQMNAIYIVQNQAFHTVADNYLYDIEIMAEILQPKYFFYGHDGQDWVKFDIS